MIENDKWFSATDLAGLEGMPSHATNVTRKGKKNGWEVRKVEGMKGVSFEFHFQSLPKITQQALISKIYYLDQDALSGKPLSEAVSHYNSNLSNNKNHEYINCSPIFEYDKNRDQALSLSYLTMDNIWLEKREFEKTDLAILKVKGDTMEPTIHNNDIVIIHLGRTRLQDGYLYAFLNQGEIFIRRYQNFLGAWKLISDNSRYENIDVKQDQFEVIGQLVYMAKNLGN